uniref:SoHo domain-containing protein n=1 Tax=Strigops habroptila TaxID=2489341 RepID=A0A672U924_STRHB
AQGPRASTRGDGGMSRDTGVPGRSLGGSLTPGVPVIHHHGSNTLNFDFHAPEAHGVAEHGRGPPKSSAPAGPTPGPGAAPPCPRPPGWSATWTKDSKRRERRWVKYDGIGPVDETGMPIASRSSVDQPRDWYRSMFRQMHRRLPGEDVELDKDMRAMETRWEPCQVPGFISPALHGLEGMWNGDGISIQLCMQPLYRDAGTAGCRQGWMQAGLDAGTAGCRQGWMRAGLGAGTAGCGQGWVRAGLDAGTSGRWHMAVPWPCRRGRGRARGRGTLGPCPAVRASVPHRRWIPSLPARTRPLG